MAEACELERRVAALERRLGSARRRGAALWLIAGAAALLAFRAAPEAKQRFTEIDAERINIVEPDGRLAMVLANTGRLPDVIIGGVERDSGRRGTRGPGMLFFNHKGDESGGLTYQTREQDGEYGASAGFSFDQYENDQVVFLSYADNGERRRAGLYVVDRPVHPNVREIIELQEELRAATGEERARMEREIRGAQERGDYGAQRVFVGSEDRTAMVRLKDPVGRDRIRLVVDDTGAARLEFLDEQGVVTHRVPE